MVQRDSPTNRKPRHDEWIRPKMVAFLRELTSFDTLRMNGFQSVRAAAQSAGVVRQPALDRLRTGSGQAPRLRSSIASARSAMMRPGAAGDGARFSRVGLTFDKLLTAGGSRVGKVDSPSVSPLRLPATSALTHP